MITITEEAKRQILAVLKSQDSPSMLRLEAKTNGTAAFVFGMKMIRQEEKRADDVVENAGEFEVVMDPDSAKNLNGSTVDFEEGILKSGFKFTNPNVPETPTLGKGPRGDLAGSIAERVQQLIDTELNPAVAAHGGVMQLMGVSDNKVHISFGGGCHGCGMVDVTLKQGVEARIKELIPEVAEVVDTTDHTTGETPFYA